MEDKRKKHLPPEEGKSNSSKLNRRSSSVDQAELKSDASVSAAADADSGMDSKDVLSDGSTTYSREGTSSEAAEIFAESGGDLQIKRRPLKRGSSSKVSVSEVSASKDFGSEDFGSEGFAPEDFGSGDFGSEDFGSGDFGSEDFGSEGFGSKDFGSGDFGSEGSPSEAPDTGDISSGGEYYSEEVLVSAVQDTSHEQTASDEQPSEQTQSGEQQAPSGDEESQNGEKELENTLDSVRRAPARRKWKTRKEKDTEYRAKILRHRKRVYQRTLISVVCCMVVIVAAVLFWMSRGYSRAELRRVCSMSTARTDSYANLGGNLVRYGAGGAVCIDRMGETLWNISYEMQQPVTSVGKNVIAIANRGGNNVYIMNSQGLMGSIRTMLPIHSVSVAENGNVAVIMNDTKTTWIRLYNKKGTEIAYIVRSMEENGYPIAAAVSPDGKTLCLSCVQMSNSVVKSNISFFDFGKKGEKAPDYRIDSSDYMDLVIPELYYMDNYTCVGVSDKSLFYFRRGLFRKKSGNNIVRHKNSLQGVFHSENFTGLLYHEASAKGEYRLIIYNRKCKKAGQVLFSMRYSNITISGDKVYINNERQCRIYSLDGRCLYSGEFGKTILALIPGARLTDLLAVTEGEVDAVKLY